MNQFATPEELEKHHVRDVYDKIAPHFVGFCHKAWPRVEEFLLTLPAGSVIADVGCGTGKYLGLAPESFVIGSDRCVEFGAIAAQRGHNVIACDNQCLPFMDSCIDAVISVGVIHHFASWKRRAKALEEIYRILRPGGRMLVYVWAFEQDQRKFDGPDVLVPYTHYQRNKVLARRRMSAPVRPRLQSHFYTAATPNMAGASWRTRRAYSCNDSRGLHIHDRKQTQKTNMVDICSDDTALGMVRATEGSKYAALQRIRNKETVPTSRPENNEQCPKTQEDNPIRKLTKFLNTVIKKIFDDDDGEESENLRSSHAHRQAQTNGAPSDTSSDFGAKLSALMSYFSAEKRERNSKVEFLSLLARKLFAGKDDLRLDNEFDEKSIDCEEICKELHLVKDQQGYGKVIIGLKEERANGHGPWGRPGRLNGVNLSVMARLVDSIATLGAVESDSSSSSDDLTSGSSSTEDWDQARTSRPIQGKKTFQHTTISCQELVEKPVCAADIDSQYSSSSSFISTSTSPSSSSPSPTPSSSSSSPRTTTSPKRAKSALLQRYYHVFCAGELVRLVQDGIPSAVVLKEYYDHGNWAVILEKPFS